MSSFIFLTDENYLRYAKVRRRMKRTRQMVSETRRARW